MFEAVYGEAFHARDSEGNLQYEVLLRLMDLHGIATADRADILTKTIRVEQLVQKKQAEMIERRIKAIDSKGQGRR